MTSYKVLTRNWPLDHEGVAKLGGQAALREKVIAGVLRPKLPDGLNPALKELIEECWAGEPEKRPTFSIICEKLRQIQRGLEKPEASGLVGRPLTFRDDVRTEREKLESEGLETSQLYSTFQGSAGAGGGDGGPVTFPSYLRIEPEMLKLGPLLGKGGSAKVYQSTWLGCKYAVKAFNSSVSPTAVQAELKFLTEFLHPCSVRLMGLSVSEPEGRYSIVMEFMGSDLRKLIDSNCMEINRTAPFDLREAVYIIRRIALGMAFLHARGVVHRDLKALNVLVPAHPGSIDVKITDFGVSQLIDLKKDHSPGGAGTSFWRAPEVLRSRADGEPMTRSNDLKAADVYSFAMTSYEVLTGKMPLHEEAAALGQSSAQRKVIEGELRPKLPYGLKPALKELVEECWAGDPKKRPTFSIICDRLHHIQSGLGKRSTSSTIREKLSNIFNI